MYNKINELLSADISNQLTEDNQVESNKYLEELKKLLQFKKQAEDKRSSSIKRTEELNKRMEELNTNYISATDQTELKNINKDRNDLIIEIESNKGIANTPFMSLLKKQLDGLEEYGKAANVEISKFKNDIEHKENEYNALKKLIEDRIVELNTLKHKHSFGEVERTLEKIKSKPKVTLKEVDKPNYNSWNDIHN